MSEDPGNQRTADGSHLLRSADTPPIQDLLLDRQITALLERSRDGDAAALSELFEALYPTLRALAHQRLMRSKPHTLLETTGLINECFLKMAAGRELRPGDRVHFLAYAATCMRSIVVDFARSKSAQRRGANAHHVTLDADIAASIPAGEEEVLVVHETIEELAAVDPRVARVVELRYFGGLSDQEIAELLAVTDRTVRRDWEKARLLLAASLRNDQALRQP